MKTKKKKFAVTVKNLNICYKCLKKTSIRASWKKIGKKIEKIEAIKNVSFDLEEGKILGIIGQNGAGKSTLLRSIAGIFSPDSGSINLYDNTISLLSIGVGFNSKLSGYENIYLSGLLLGFTEEQIRAKEKDIIEFADIGEFIYKPVKTYSSGMHSKLAFAITAILETNIILIDEVLSVGDSSFRKKSYNKMKELICDKNRTVIIVSHNLETIKELCDEVIWLHQGKLMLKGDPQMIINKFEEFNKNNTV